MALGHSGRSACRIAGVHRSTFLRQRRQPLSTRTIRRIVVADEISRIHAQSRGTYGKRRIKAALLAECEMIVNHKLVASIMAERGLFGLPRRKRRGHPMLAVSTPADLVNRAFTAARPNELWCTDITEHPARDGKVYCCAILDCFSKKIVGRAFSTIADTLLVNNAVNMAMTERVTAEGLIVHADHGTQFTSWSFGENLRRHRILPSFGTVGDCFDNAAMESFWGRMQTELLNTRKWSTTLELTIAMSDWIDNFYNTERRHSYLGHLSPTEYETLWLDIQPSPQLS
ncbi:MULTISPECIES: IS3 family transposase [Nocardia]|uniref:IS3 family transposase n=1 Tax=Nocardia abscessus TaxID=120957 RepID=UPI002453CFF3|nr:IS3 family transposase [Nocardia abscessus]